MIDTNNGSPAIMLDHVSKVLKGRVILSDISLRVPYGEIVGIRGSNGAGKTLLLRLMSGLVYASHGQIVVGGKVLRSSLAGPLAPVGLLLETPGFLTNLSGRDNLTLLAMIDGPVQSSQITFALQQVSLDPEDRRPVKMYSLGMRQRLGLAQALMRESRILLLDEPTNGLDPEFTQALIPLLQRRAQEGTAIVTTSHALGELNRLAHRILTIKNGVLEDASGSLPRCDR